MFSCPSVCVNELPFPVPSSVYPARFMLVAAMNPTPDGKMPAESRCSPREIQNYLGKISRPLLHRIDIHDRRRPWNRKTVTLQP